MPPEVQSQAYLNRPSGIGYGQTISQPFIVALMTEALSIAPTDRVLEIGTGSGYQAAILGELAAEVYSVEIVPELAARAKTTLTDQGYDNVNVRHSDGWDGWPQASPFDKIIVTAAAATIPPRLIEQLKDGGRMVLPIGKEHRGQMLTLIEKSITGTIRTTDVLPVIFVPMTGGKDKGLRNTALN